MAISLFMIKEVIKAREEIKRGRSEFLTQFVHSCTGFVGPALRNDYALFEFLCWLLWIETKFGEQSYAIYVLRGYGLATDANINS